MQRAFVVNAATFGGVELGVPGRAIPIREVAPFRFKQIGGIILPGGFVGPHVCEGDCRGMKKDAKSAAKR